jgi:hypothetical protein
MTFKHEDFLKADYRFYPAYRNVHWKRHYQKTIWDASKKKKKYFIDAYYYNFPEAKITSVAFKVNFCLVDEVEFEVEINSRNFSSIQEAEVWFEDFWVRNSCTYDIHNN